MELVGTHCTSRGAGFGVSVCVCADIEGDTDHALQHACSQWGAQGAHVPLEAMRVSSTADSLVATHMEHGVLYGASGVLVYAMPWHSRHCFLMPLPGSDMMADGRVRGGRVLLLLL